MGTSKKTYFGGFAAYRGFLCVIDLFLGGGFGPLGGIDTTQPVSQAIGTGERGSSRRECVLNKITM